MIFSYDKRDVGMNVVIIQFIANELQDGTYKMIGIATHTCGHYMVMCKNSKGDINI